MGSQKQKCRIAASSIFLGIGIVLLVLATVFYLIPKMIDSTQYALVFDAGSTHTDMTIFEWPPKLDQETAVITQAIKDPCNVEGLGISSYADNPQGAGKSLEKCLDFAKSTIQARSQSISSVFLGATAGMRLLHIQSPEKSDKVLESVRNTLSNSGFQFEPEHAAITTGEDEGASAWISANLILGNFQKNSNGKNVSMMGTLDMGGASTQIAFLVDDAPPSDQLKNLRIYGVDYKVYSATFLCYGLTQFIVRNRINLILEEIVLFQNMKEVYEIQDPCLPREFNETVTFSDLLETGCGPKSMDNFPVKNPKNSSFLFIGSGAPLACERLVLKSMDFDKCKDKYEFCFDSSNLPPVKGNFKAVSSYFYTKNFYNYTTDGPKDLRTLTIEQCTKDWNTLSKENPSNNDPKHMKQFCTSGLFVNNILEKYGFNRQDWKQIDFVKKIGKVNLGWQLGYITNISNILPSEKVKDKFIKSDIYYPLLAASLVVILVALIGVYLYCKPRKSDSLPISFSRAPQQEGRVQIS